jgi:hypothetical protein
MSSYRIYLLDEVGSIAACDDYECADDAAATELAATLGPMRSSVEIWQGTRCVGSVSAPSRSAGINGFSSVT